MSFDQFIMAHPELQDLPDSTQRESYQMYLEQLDGAMSQMEDE